MEAKFIFVNGGSAALDSLPPRAVSLDGYVQGPVMGDDQDRWSFDHHAGCVRLITLATCQQVLRALDLGFSFDNREVYVNDIDGDTILSLYLIRHPLARLLPAVRDLVEVVGIVDALGPSAYATISSVNRALSQAFFDGVCADLDDVQAKFEQWPNLVQTAFDRLKKLVTSGWDFEPPIIASTVKILRDGVIDGNSACIAVCDGFDGFEKLYRDGFKIVCLTTGAANGTNRYTVGKLSDLVRYSLGPADVDGTLLNRLSRREPGWGGGTSIGGSPRLPGGESSRLTVDDVWTIMSS